MSNRNNRKSTAAAAPAFTSESEAAATAAAAAAATKAAEAAAAAAATDTAAAAVKAAAAATEAATLAVSKAAEAAALPDVLPSFASLRSRLIIGDDESVTLAEGATITPDDVVTLGVGFDKESRKAGATCANVLRIARTLPAVELVANGKIVPVPAFDYVCAKMKDAAPTPSTWSNIKGLVECADLVEANALNVSVYTVKEVIGTLRKIGAFEGETLVLKDLKAFNEAQAKGVKAAELPLVGPIVRALMNGDTAAAAKEAVTTVKANNPKLFPKAAAAAAAVSRDEKPAEAAAGEAAAAAAETPVIGGKVIQPEEVARMIQSAIGLWDKAVAQGATVVDMRKACATDMSALATLAGYKLLPF